MNNGTALNLRIKKEESLSRFLSERLKKIVIPFLLGAMILVLFLATGICFGNPDIAMTLSDEAYDSGSELTEGGVIGPETEEEFYAQLDGQSDFGGLDAAYAINSAGTMGPGSVSGNNGQYKTWSFTYTGNPGNNMSRTWYWAGNSSNFNSSTWGGGWQLWGSGTVRQKEIIFRGYVYLSFSTFFRSLAGKGKLYLTGIWGDTYSVNGYDQDIRWGLAWGAVDPQWGGGNQVPASDNRLHWHRYTKGNGQGGRQGSNGAWQVPSWAGGVTIMLMCRTNYTSWIGGRYPGAKLQNIWFGFEIRDTAAPTVNLNNVGGWAQSKSVKFTLSDDAAGVNSVQYSTNNGASYTNLGSPYNIKVVTTALKIRAYDKASNSRVYDFSLTTLKIDRSAPTITGLTFVDTGGAKISKATSGQINLRITTSDVGSGVSSVAVTNKSTGKTYTAKKVSANNYLVENVDNGQYSVVAKDGVGWSSATKTANLIYKDTQMPTVSVSMTATSATNYAKSAITATITVTDGTGDTNANVLNLPGFAQARAIKSLVVFDGARTYKATAGTPTYSGGKVTVKYTVQLPFTGSYTFKATDNVDMTATTFSLNGGAAVESTYVFIDTTAPWISGVTSSGDANLLWTSSDVTLTVNFKDDGYTAPSGQGLNQGSGVEKVRLFYANGSLMEEKSVDASATSVSFTLTKNYNENASYKIVLVDAAGNTSDLGAGAASFNGVNYSNYYQNKNNVNLKNVTIYKDSNPVKIQVLSADKTTEYSADPYTLPWTTAASTTFVLRVTFGPSGVTLRNKVGSSDAFLSISGGSFQSAKENSAFNNAANVREVTVTYSAQGVIPYQFQAANGAGKIATSNVVNTRMDRTPPEVKLLGFGSSLSGGASLTTEEDIINNIEDFISESDFYNSTSWYKSSIRAFILISDSYSGADGSKQSYSGGTQSSLAKGTLSFSHNGYTYTEVTPYYSKQGGGYYVLGLLLWSEDHIRAKARNASGQSIVMSDGSLDILYGQGIPFTYNIEISDFIGNKRFVTNSNNSSNLNYNVDPFNISMEIVSIKTADGADYDYTPDGKSWTRQAVTVTINKTMGLSPTFINYGTSSIEDKDDGTTSGLGVSPTSAWMSATTDSGSSRTATVVLTAESRSEQLFFKVFNSARESQTFMFNGERIVVRQDTDIPTMVSFFFSVNPDIDFNPFVQGALNKDVLLYYEAQRTDNVYTVTRKYVNENLDTVWVHDDVYLYVMATDYNGKGMGSGITYVQITYNGSYEYLYTSQTGEYPKSMVYYDSASKIGLYRSNNTYGYTKATEVFGLSFKLIDNQNNSHSFSVEKDSDGHKLLPVVDKVIPNVSIESAYYGGSQTNYLENGKLIGSEDNIIREDLTVNFIYTSGISDVGIYARKNVFDVPLDPNDPIVGFSSDALSGKYGLISQAGIDLNDGSWELLDGKTASGAAEGALWRWITEASGKSIKNRYDIIIVNGAGVYYYLDAGNVFIDTVAPEIHDELTFFALAGDAENTADVINFDSLKKIDLSTYTNDNVYAYFRITDAASGIGEVYTYLSGVKTSLEKVTVRRSVDGVYSEEEYYRLLLTENLDYKIIAVDKATNVSESASFKPLIDKTEVDLKITAVTASDKIYTSGKFTNENYIRLTLYVTTGISGFSETTFMLNDEGPFAIDSLLNEGSWVITDNGRSATVSFFLAEEQNKTYTFRAYNNIDTEYAVDGIKPFYERQITIAIDRTAPVIDENDGNYLFVTENWHPDGQVLQLNISDPNDYGSGIASVKIDFTLNGVAQPQAEMKLSDDGYYYSYYKDKEFALGYYADYTLTLTDNAGNRTVKVIRPKVDTVDPSFGAYADGSLFRLMTAARSDDEEKLTPYEYTPDTWAKMNVENYMNIVYSISGARLQYAYAVKDGTSFGEWKDAFGAQFDWGVEVPPTEACGTTVSVNDFIYLFDVAFGGSMDYTYKFRIVSGAGRVSEELTVGRIKIDKVKPEIVVNTRINGNNTDYGTAGENETVLPGWIDNYLYVNVSTPSTLVSGYTVYYNISQSDTPDWKPITLGFVNNQNFNFDYKTQLLIHTVTNSTNNETYSYYFESASGMRSEIYHVRGIKIDMVNPSFTIFGEESDSFGTPNTDPDKLNTGTAADYTGDPDKNYNFANAVWTDRNSVVMKILIEEIRNYSGLSLYINDVLYEEIPYGTPTPYESYYVVDKTSDFTLVLRSGANKTAQQSAKVRIDNVIPMLYLAGVEGNKSTNWDDTAPNSWYTSVTRLNFKVGTLVKGEDGTYSFSDDFPASGYEIQYRTGREVDDSWNSNDASTVLTVVGNPAEQNDYSFRIVSGSGMTFTLGSAALDNMGSVAFTNEEISLLIGSAGGLISHLSEEDFKYIVNVDSNVYYLTTRQLLELEANGRDILVTSTTFADYTVELLLNGSFTVIPVAEQIFHRGDYIRVSYDTNDYIHRYTDYGVIDENGDWTDVKETYEGTADNEIQGSFEFRYVNSSYTVKAYFMKELDVTYGKTVMYKQSETEAAVTASTSFTYTTDQGAIDTVTIPLQITYTDMDGVPAQADNLSLGGYIVNTEVVGKNALSFRLTNPQTVLLVKYFDEKLASDGSETANSETNPYDVRAAVDMEYLSAVYYKDYTQTEKGFVLGTPYSYSTAYFRMSEDITLADTFTSVSGVFSGSFDGNGHTVTRTGGIRVDGNYGLFENLSGSVDNLTVKLNGEISLYNVSRAGILAQTITGGKVTDTVVQGRFNVITAAMGAQIGGLAGSITGAEIGSYSGVSDRHPVYIDVVISNLGNAVASASVGGLTGYLGDAKLFHTYTYSHLTFYNVDGGVKVGAVIGEAERTTYGEEAYEYFFNNRYLAANVFLNDALKDGFTGVATDINDATESKNTVQGLSYENFIGVGSASQAGTVNVNGSTIRTMVLDRLYSDFGIEDAEYASGTGIEADPLQISVVTQLRAIDEYMNLSFSLIEDLDLSDFGQAIGLHKVYAGKFFGNEHKLNSFGMGYDISDGDRIGLFAEVSGTVADLIFLDVAVNYEGNIGNLYSAVVAARLNGGTVGNVYAIGTSVVDNGNGTLYSGAVAGEAVNATVYDIFSIVNIKVSTTTEVYAGGIIGKSDSTRLGSYTDKYNVEKVGAVFALGRTEIVGDIVHSASAVAEGTVQADSVNVFTIAGNVYTNGKTVDKTLSDAISIVDFESLEMRSEVFSNGVNAFNKVFETDNLYYLQGKGISTDKFIVSNVEDFAKIEHMLYADYNIANDIDFGGTEFKTIGEGLLFTGSIDGKNENSGSAEEGTVSSLTNVTDAFVYNNAGSISDLVINIQYERTIDGEDLVFGAVAIINSIGTIRNVTVSGTIDINALNKNSSVTVSGFVGIAEGGRIETDSKVQNSISGLSITVSDVLTVYAGGFIGLVEHDMTLTYGIGDGELIIENCDNVNAGTLVGRANAVCDWSSIAETEEYRYTVFIDGVESTELFGYKSV